jgi:UDP-N-acetyl-D-mannosaminuronate dehydrogenase
MLHGGLVDLKVLVVGMGEVGQAIYKLVSEKYDVETLDVEPKQVGDAFDVLHVCYPYMKGFVDTTVQYVERFNPGLVLIESTVKPGATMDVNHRVGCHVVHSPVRGRLAETILWGLRTYTKFIGGCCEEAAEQAAEYYGGLGLSVAVASSPFDTEFAKIMNLSYYGACIGVFQEFERVIEQHGLDRGTVMDFIGSTDSESMGKVPRPLYSGGYIGGHCVVPGLEKLQEHCQFQIFREVIKSNEQREKEV